MAKRQNYNLVDEARRGFSGAQSRYVYGVGMDTLERLCRRFPEHEKLEPTVAKLWLIGRSHSAALERRRGHRKYSDPYIPTARILGNGRLDRLLRNVRSRRPSYSPEHLEAIVDAVEYLTDVFRRTTGLRKPSLASKYLHFHDPRIPKFDSIASDALRRLLRRSDIGNGEDAMWRRGGYARHLARFVAARRMLRGKGLSPLTAHRLDVFLLDWNQ